MNKFPGSFKVKITLADGSFWFATSLLYKVTPEKTCEFLNNQAIKNKINSTYEPATIEQYNAYKENK